jgi:prepilin-type N-terminal cleavage/methylation domain-containing protein
MQATLERLRARRDERGDEGGFTLIELLIVIVILAILAAIVVFAVQNLTGQSAKASCNSDFKTVESALETFKAQTGAYPGGTYNSGVTLTPALAASYPNYNVGTANTTAAPILDLLGTATTGAGPVGPWLKDAPVNANHYEIGADNGGAGHVTVYTSNGNASIPAAPTNTINDCSTVS